MGNSWLEIIKGGGSSFTDNLGGTKVLINSSGLFFIQIIQFYTVPLAARPIQIAILNRQRLPDYR